MLVVFRSSLPVRSERVVARLLKISKTPGRKCILVTAKLWFEDLNSWYLATAHMKAHIVEQSAIIFSPFFLFFFFENKEVFGKVLIFFKYILVSSFFINKIACWYSHSYRLLALLSSHLHLVLVMGKKLVNEHFSSSFSWN